MQPKRDKIIVAMSGGVDSSVAAVMLQKEGYDVTGVFLSRKCAGQGCSSDDGEDANRVAEVLGIRLIKLDATETFEPIIENFVTEYVRGRTPNPCIHCNTRIKFGLLFDLADSLGAKYVATGHHARIGNIAGEPAVMRSKMRRKDQSYALFGIRRDRLARILLPIGEIDGKDNVRQIAREMNLPVHDKPDSQEICFVPDDDYVRLLGERAPEALQAGKIVTSDGKILGDHDGYARFTIGQRRGLRVATGEPLYVIAIDPKSATVTVGPRNEVMGNRLVTSNANWHANVPDEFNAVIQIRYNHNGAAGKVKITSPTTFEAEFDEPVSAITPGQAAVVYDGERLLGGGWIE
jgi:tRNA-specific 2-thiouridylase